MRPVTKVSNTLAGETNAQLVARLRADIDRGLAVLPRQISSKPYALIDHPDHPNVGDSAIWAGEVAWLMECIGRPPAYVCRQDVDWQRLDAVAQNGVVLLHGGGNFGDVWEWFQEFRISLLKRYVGIPIVQFPQSIHFSEGGGILEETKKAIAQHGAFTLNVRDEWSYSFAKDNFDCEVNLIPDMAFCLGVLKRPSAPSQKRLALLRTDKEARSDSSRQALGLSDVEIVDWLEGEPKNLHNKALWRARSEWVLHPIRSFRSRSQREFRYFNALAEMRVQRGLRLLSQGEYIVTDRLHAHILSTLLGIPHTVLDNSYGKIGRYMQAHKTQWSGVKIGVTGTRNDVI